MQDLPELEVLMGDLQLPAYIARDTRITARIAVRVGNEALAKSPDANPLVFQPRGEGEDEGELQNGGLLWSCQQVVNMRGCTAAELHPSLLREAELVIRVYGDDLMVGMIAVPLYMPFLRRPGLIDFVVATGALHRCLSVPVTDASNSQTSWRLTTDIVSFWVAAAHKPPLDDTSADHAPEFAALATKLAMPMPEHNPEPPADGLGLRITVCAACWLPDDVLATRVDVSVVAEGSYWSRPLAPAPDEAVCTAYALLDSACGAPVFQVSLDVPAAALQHSPILVVDIVALIADVKYDGTPGAFASHGLGGGVRAHGVPGVRAVHLALAYLPLVSHDGDGSAGTAEGAHALHLCAPWPANCMPRRVRLSQLDMRPALPAARLLVQVVGPDPLPKSWPEWGADALIGNAAAVAAGFPSRQQRTDERVALGLTAHTHAGDTVGAALGALLREAPPGIDLMLLQEATGLSDPARALPPLLRAPSVCYQARAGLYFAPRSAFGLPVAAWTAGYGSFIPSAYALIAEYQSKCVLPGPVLEKSAAKHPFWSRSGHGLPVHVDGVYRPGALLLVEFLGVVFDKRGVARVLPQGWAVIPAFEPGGGGYVCQGTHRVPILSGRPDDAVLTRLLRAGADDAGHAAAFTGAGAGVVDEGHAGKGWAEMDSDGGSGDEKKREGTDGAEGTHGSGSFGRSSSARVRNTDAFGPPWAMARELRACLQEGAVNLVPGASAVVEVIDGHVTGAGTRDAAVHLPLREEMLAAVAGEKWHKYFGDMNRRRTGKSLSRIMPAPSKFRNLLLLNCGDIYGDRGRHMRGIDIDEAYEWLMSNILLSCGVEKNRLEDK